MWVGLSVEVGWLYEKKEVFMSICWICEVLHWGGTNIIHTIATSGQRVLVKVVVEAAGL